MAKKTIKAQMKQRRDTKANWAATNPVLLDGELGIVSDDPNLYKVGDGATAWNSLPFRGFDGTLAQELGTSENAVISQKVVSEKLTELESKVQEDIAEIKPIVINGNVVNAADEEDITSADNLLKLKDRDDAFGMGYVILRKNKTFAEQVTKENTIYEIRYDFDLMSASHNIPSNCTLLFEGGKVSNGTIIGNNTNIIAASKEVLNVGIEGVWSVSKIDVAWFGVATDGITDDSPAFAKAARMAHDGCEVYVGNGVFAFASTVAFVGLSNIRISLGGTILAAKDTVMPYGLIALRGCKNVEINGLHIDGNAANIPAATEAGTQCLLEIANCDSVAVDNLTLKNSVACGVCGGANTNLSFTNVIMENLGEHGFYFGGDGSHNVRFSNLKVTDIGQGEIYKLRECSVIQYRPHSADDSYSDNILVENIAFDDNGNYTSDGLYSQHRYLLTGGHIKNFTIRNGHINGNSIHILNIDATNDYGVVENITFNGRSIGFKGNKHHYMGGSIDIAGDEYGENSIILRSCHISCLEELGFYNYDYDECHIYAPSLIGGSYVWFARKCTIRNCEFKLGGWRIDYQGEVEELVFHDCKFITEGGNIVLCQKDAVVRFYNCINISSTRPSLVNANSYTASVYINGGIITADLAGITTLNMQDCDYVPASGAQYIARDDGNYCNVRIGGSRADYKKLSLVSYGGSTGQTIDFRFGYIRMPKESDVLIVPNPISAGYTISLASGIMQITKADTSVNVTFNVIVSM